MSEFWGRDDSAVTTVHNTVQVLPTRKESVTLCGDELTTLIMVIILQYRQTLNPCPVHLKLMYCISKHCKKPQLKK